MRNSVTIAFSAALLTAVVTFAIPASACNGGGNCDKHPAIPKGCLARSLAQGCRSSLWAMASIGWFVAAATRSNPLQNLGTAAAG